jgi:hypothetical protein
MFLVLDSANAKIGLASATYAPIAQTCPSSCPLRDSGCYALARGAVIAFETHGANKKRALAVLQ